MPTLECSGGFQPASGRTADGRLWFPTRRGLVVIYPYDVKTNELAPPVVIERLLMDGYPVSLAAGTSPLRITPGRHRLEFFYTGLSFVVPEKVRFKFKLEGLEKDWVNAGTMRSIAYNYVPPGNYVFHVIACNNDGIWNLDRCEPTDHCFAFLLANTLVPGDYMHYGGNGSRGRRLAWNPTPVAQQT